MPMRPIITMAVLLVAVPLSAATLRVPLDHADLPTALAVAQDGDTVAVAASYVAAGGLVVPGRGFFLLGGWDDGFQDVVGQTEIVGSPAAPAMRLEPPATGSPVVAGLAITGGGGADRSAPENGRYGGAVLIEGGDPILRNITITAAEAGDAPTFGAGGGLALLDTDATLENVVVTDCRAVWGSGIYIDGGAPVLRDCVLLDNACRAGSGPEEARGAGIAANLADVVIETTEIRGGRGAVRGGGIAWLGTRGRVLEIRDCDIHDNEMDLDGGGLFAEAGTVTVSGGRFADNGPSPGAPYTSGGGAYLTGARATLENVTFTGNRADAGGGATVNTAAEADVLGCIFLTNEATLFGAALNYQSNDAGLITGNTAADNDGSPDSGVVNLVNCSPGFARNLIALNLGGGVAVAAGSIAPACNDVFGNAGLDWTGTPDPTGLDGNFAADPLFCDLAGGDVSLDAGSPCLDSVGCGQIGAGGEGCGVGVAVGDLPATGPAVTAFPNPFNPAVTLRVRLTDRGPVHLSIHDLRGRQVRVLLIGNQPSGWIEARWDGRDQSGRSVSSGIYGYRLVTPDHEVAGRLTLVR